MIVYSVSGDSEPMTFHATRAEAIADARARSKADPELTVQVEHCVLVRMTKAAILRLLNMTGGYVEDSFVAAAYRNGRLQPLDGGGR